MNDVPTLDPIARTGISHLDELLGGGLRPSSTVGVLGGNASSRTGFLGGLAAAAALQGRPVLFAVASSPPWTSFGFNRWSWSGSGASALVWPRFVSLGVSARSMRDTLSNLAAWVEEIRSQHAAVPLILVADAFDALLDVVDLKGTTDLLRQVVELASTNRTALAFSLPCQSRAMDRALDAEGDRLDVTLCVASCLPVWTTRLSHVLYLDPVGAGVGRVIVAKSRDGERGVVRAPYSRGRWWPDPDVEDPPYETGAPPTPSSGAPTRVEAVSPRPLLNGMVATLDGVERRYHVRERSNRAGSRQRPPARASVPAVDLHALDPGIRETVRRLREAGFDTTDSGDGVWKCDPEVCNQDCVMGVPNVAIRVADANDLLDEADRLADVLQGAGIALTSAGRAEAASIQASYDPTDGSAVILLTGLSDASWGPR